MACCCWIACLHTAEACQAHLHTMNMKLMQLGRSQKKCLTSTFVNTHVSTGAPYAIAGHLCGHDIPEASMRHVMHGGGMATPTRPHLAGEGWQHTPWG